MTILTNRPFKGFLGRFNLRRSDFFPGAFFVFLPIFEKLKKIKIKIHSFKGFKIN